MQELDYNIFCKNLRRLMKRKKVSIMKLAEETGICSSTINCYRLGKAFPTSPKIQLMAGALDVEVSEFFREKGKFEISLAGERNRAIEDCKEVVRTNWINGKVEFKVAERLYGEMERLKGQK